ncbi:hypothetical protein BCR33DRAFT_715323 [Rhizoclosmatium globosum]|uniref:Nucleoside phosphatase GDA1/CD39 n=1 Tax=Rhizoclosmatium globosum TaxID=329046 RepID=A0A1Y2CIQ1_9FUNG|nr:hypothetical protein BCR33DRAFT_715323 [Rhizoclosmatium globosum]|eukprot:ORY46921.1 hypothetical protein BCR33DRAFT_715323 [Rhizoclosmatium globosum]
MRRNYSSSSGTAPLSPALGGTSLGLGITVANPKSDLGLTRTSSTASFAALIEQPTSPSPASATTPPPTLRDSTLFRDPKLFATNTWVAVSFWLCGGMLVSRSGGDYCLVVVLVALMGTLAVSFSVSGSGTQERPSVHQHLPVNSSIEPVDLAMLALDTGFPVYKPTTVSKEWSTDWYADRRYGIVIDAGSSGSRALIYSWKVFDHPSQKRDLLPLIEKAFPESELNPVGEGKKGRKWSKAIEPGLSSLFNPKKAGDTVKLDQVSDYLAPLLKFSESVVPTSLHSSTPVYLLATAGMRLVPPLQRAQILQHACETFRVISGEAEGVFGWVAVNYLNKGFGDRTLQVPPPPHKESPNTFGFLDMGGASTQIAFEPVESMKLQHSDDLHKVVLRNVAGRDLRTDVRRRYLEGIAVRNGFRVVKDRRRDGVVSAVQADLKENDKEEFVPLYDSCLPSGLNRPPRPALVGNGSLLNCLSELNPYLNNHLPCHEPPCLFNDFGKHRFLGVAEYYYTPTGVKGAVTEKGVYLFDEFVKSADSICRGPWSKVRNEWLVEHEKEEFEDSVEEGRVMLQCFKSAWVLEVLHEGFGIPRNEVLKEGGVSRDSYRMARSVFEPVHELGGFPISWTLGALLVHVCSTIDDGRGSRRLSIWLSGTGIRAALVISCIAITVFLGIVFWRQYKRAKANLYRRRGSRAEVPHLTTLWADSGEDSILMGEMNV